MMEKRERNSYWVSMFGQNILYCIISTGLLYYFQNIIFIPVTFIGVVVLIAQIIDAVKDPIMGIVIDKTESRLGKCRFYLIIGLPIAMCATIIPFINGTYNSNNTGLENNLILIWVFVSYIIWLLAFTLIDVPLWSLASCITSDKRLRENLLMGARVAASLAAGLVPLIIVPISQLVAEKIKLLWHIDENLKAGTIIVVVLLTILGGGLMVPNNIFSKERVVNSKTSKLSIKEMLAIVFSNKDYLRLIGSGVLRSPIMILGIAEMTMFSYYFGNNGREDYVIYMIILGGGYLMGQIIATTIGPALTQRIKKKLLYISISVILAAASLVFWLFYINNPTNMIDVCNIIVLFIIFVLEGGGVGILNYLQSVMIIDCVDVQEQRTNTRLDGIFMSGQSFAIKISTGIATIVMTILYNWVGFTDDTIRTINEMLAAGANFRTDIFFEPYRNIIFFVCSVPAAIGIVLSIIPMLKYDS